jgi:hypothetical protein
MIMLYHSLLLALQSTATNYARMKNPATGSGRKPVKFGSKVELGDFARTAARKSAQHQVP